jgi:hypothetical protein
MTTIQLSRDEASILGALLDHAAAYAEGRPILLVVDAHGVQLQVGDSVGFPTFGEVAP